MDDITQYFPYYPDIDDKEFEMIINKKKEFNELQDQALNDLEYELKTYQKFANRYISGYTLFDQILVANDMGTGKTLLAISIIEEYKRSFFRTGFNYDQMKKALIIVKSEETSKNFIEEIYGNSYSGHLYRKSDGSNDKKLMKSIYSIKTYKEFFDEYNNNPDTFVSNFSNSVVIIDEVHNLRVTGNSKNASKQYERIHKFLHDIKNSKIVLMTGTPMRDKSYEIAEIYNLILPLDEQFETKMDFNNQYLQNTEEFKKKIRGRTVSLKSLEEKDVSKVFVSNNIEDSDLNVKLLYEEMEPLQGASYDDAFFKDGGNKIDIEEEDNEEYVGEESKGTLYQNSRQAINFVYPDGSYGSKGYDKYVVASTKQIKKSKKKKSKYNLSEEFRDFIRTEMKSVSDDDILLYNGYNLSDEYKRKLRVIKKLSTSYHDSILGLLTDPGKALIFLELINGSGCRIFSLLLEQFGFSQFSKTDDIASDANRYLLITGSVGNIADTIQYFNHSDNWDGSKIKVLIGTKTISESYSLKDVRHVRILMPFWNFAIIHQTLARAFRIGSFTYTKRNIENAESKIDVKIYYHCPYHENIEQSVSYKMYKRCYEKELNIRKIMRAIREASIDCYVDREINMKGIDGSPECDYTECKYECDNIDKKVLDNLKESDLDYTTYINFYTDDVERYAVDTIKMIFRTKDTIEFNELEKKLPFIHNSTVLLKILYSIIHNLVPINNRFNEPCFLKQYNNIYFIARDQRYDIDQVLIDTNNMAYYANNKITTKYNTFDKILAFAQLQNIQITVDKAKKAKSSKKIRKILDRIEAVDLLAILQRAVKDKFDEKGGDFIDKIHEAYKNEIWTDDNMIIVNVKGKSKCFDTKTKEWRDCKGSESTKRRDELIKKKLAATRKDLLFIGIMDDKKDFRIKTISEKRDARVNTGGSKFMTKPTLAFIAYNIGMRWNDYDISYNKDNDRKLIESFQEMKTDEEKMNLLERYKSILDKVKIAKSFERQQNEVNRCKKDPEAILNIYLFDKYFKGPELMDTIKTYMIENDFLAD